MKAFGTRSAVGPGLALALVGMVACLVLVGCGRPSNPAAEADLRRQRDELKLIEATFRDTTLAAKSVSAHLEVAAKAADDAKESERDQLKGEPKPDDMKRAIKARLDQVATELRHWASAPMDRTNPLFSWKV